LYVFDNDDDLLEFITESDLSTAQDIFKALRENYNVTIYSTANEIKQQQTSINNKNSEH